MHPLVTLWHGRLVSRELNASLLQRAYEPTQTYPVFSGL